MRYPQEVIEEVRSGNDIVDVVGGYVVLRNRGGNFFGLCPFHNEKTPSFSVSADKQMYHCFGCGAGGNVISFIMQIENYDFLDALRFLADRIHYVLPQPNLSQDVIAQRRTSEILRTIHKNAARFYYETLQGDTDLAAAARKYLSDRGLEAKICKKFGLGLSSDIWDELYKNLQKYGFSLPDMIESGLVRTGKKSDNPYDRFRGRLMFPIIDVDNNVIGFGGRVMKEEKDGKRTAKYLNSPETPIFDKSRQLYGIYAARKARNNEIILVEGYMDVISLHQAGFPQTVGVLGTALTAHHTRLLKRINCTSVILLFDRDQAGTEAVLRAIPILLGAGLRVKCLQVTEDVKDPDEYIQKHGPAHFRQLLESAKSHAAFRINLLAKEHDLSSTDQRIDFTQKAAEVLSAIDNAIEADAYIRETSKLTGIAPEAIKAEMDKFGNKRGLHFSQMPAPRDRPGLRHNLRNRRAERGLFEARKGLLSILFAYPEISRKMREFLSPEEMGEGVEKKLLEFAYGENQENIKTSLADIVAQFETLEEHKRTTELLKDTPHFESEIAMEKAINEMWRIVKRAQLEHKIEKLEQVDDETDLNAINTLGKAIRNLEKQYITITNG